MSKTHSSRVTLPLASLLLILLSSSASAKNYTLHHETMEVRLGGGYLTGQSGEYVYDADGAVTGIAGYKMSQLDWKIDTAYMVGVGTSLKLGRRTRFNLDYWQNAADGEATMDDYDWFYVGADWSEWSHHDNTTVTEISNVDVNGEVTFLKFDNEQASITGIVGYRQDHMKWVAVGGTAIYSIDSYRDSKVIFPETKGITYEQNFKTPYIGLGIHSAGESNELPIVLGASVHYSGWAQGDDSDTHHLRNLLFEESGDGGKWLGMNLSLEFFLSQVMSLNIAYAYQNYQEIKASTTMTDLTTGDVTYFGGASAGLNHSSRRTSVQFSYHF